MTLSPRKRHEIMAVTYTYAILELSEASYNETREKLEKAGY
jgi:hypothetical protein